MRPWRKAEDAALAAQVRDDYPLCMVAPDLGRSFGEALERVTELDLRAEARPGPPPKIPRGKGYSKSEVASAYGVLISFDGNIIESARNQGLNPDLLAEALRRDNLGVGYLSAQDQFRIECPYCTRRFFPTNAAKQFCSSKCSADARRDESYFGGNRRKTLGLLAGICQVCAGKPQKGISSHHVLGKAHDPDNEYLIAVCSGCHDLITRLSRRRWHPGSWDALVTLASVRESGHIPQGIVRV